MPAPESTCHALARRLSRSSSPRGLVGLGRVQTAPAIVHPPIHRDAGPSIPFHPRAPSPSSHAEHRLRTAQLGMAADAPGEGSAVHVRTDFSQPAHRRQAARRGTSCDTGHRKFAYLTFRPLKQAQDLIRHREVFPATDGSHARRGPPAIPPVDGNGVSRHLGVDPDPRGQRFQDILSGADGEALPRLGRSRIMRASGLRGTEAHAHARRSIGTRSGLPFSSVAATRLAMTWRRCDLG